MSGFQSPITILQAIQCINRNEYLLPSFQREYVWSAGQVENLFDSLMKGYPISSMLFWKVRGEAKKKYRFYSILRYYIEHFHIHNDAFNTDQINDFWAVLDGQQRLTSLYLGLCGSYAYKRPRAWRIESQQNYPTRHLYLNLSRTYPEDESDKTYDFIFKDKAESGELPIYIDSDDNKWFRVSKIIGLHLADDGKDIDDFSDEYELKREEKKILRRLDNTICTETCINYYEEDTDSPDKAVNIFVRINSGGTQLSFSDILLSIATASWSTKDARNEINNLVDEINAMDFNIPKDLVLKTFLVLYNRDVRFRIKSFNNEFISTIEKNWEKIRECLRETFRLLKVLGFNSRTLTSNNAVLPIVFYLYYSGRYRKIAKSAAEEIKRDRSLIRQWILRSLLLRSFGSGSSDHAITQARKAMLDDNSSEMGIKPKEMNEFPSKDISDELKQSTLLNKEKISEFLQTQKDDKYAFSILAALYPHLDYTNNNFHLDHMHPAAAFDSDGDHEWEVHNSILNLQMLDANENMSKNAISLKEWVDSNLANGNDKRNFYQSHIIPNVDLDYFNFNQFVSEREKLLTERLLEALSI